ncbi:MAG TPA: YbaB/EbfC family nucleoid-associated protein, partial [Phytomonospora sp.]
ILDAMPTSAELAAMRREQELLGAAVADLEQARYEGTDDDGMVRVDMDYSGDPAELEFTVAASRNSARDLAEAIVDAWDAAETARGEGMLAYGEAIADAERRLRGER